MFSAHSLNYLILLLKRILETLPLFLRWEEVVKFLGKSSLWNQKDLGSNSDSELERSCNFAYVLKLSTVCFFLSQTQIVSPP